MWIFCITVDMRRSYTNVPGLDLKKMFVVNDTINDFQNICHETRFSLMIQ